MTALLDVERIYRDGRTHVAWQDKPVDTVVLERAYNLARMAPTSANCCPLRVVFISSKEGKERLHPALDEGNIDKTMAAPTTAILAYDMQFYDALPRLFPHADARSWFAGNEPLIADTAYRNGTLQAGYFLLALRAVGLDCGPMSGFKNAAVDDEFFADTAFKSNFLMNIGYGDPSVLHPRSPRFDFAEVCSFV